MFQQLNKMELMQLKRILDSSFYHVKDYYGSTQDDISDDIIELYWSAENELGART